MERGKKFAALGAGVGLVFGAFMTMTADEIVTHTAGMVRFLGPDWLADYVPLYADKVAGPLAGALFLGGLIWAVLPPKKESSLLPLSDTHICDVIDYIVNDTGMDLPTFGFEGPDGKTTLEGAEYYSAVRLINEAASAGRIRLSGRRQKEHTHSMPYYDDYPRPIETEYWIKARIEPHGSFDREGWPQTKITVTTDGWVPTYKGLSLNRAEMLAEWPPRPFVKRWLRRLFCASCRIRSPLEKYNVTGSAS